MKRSKAKPAQLAGLSVLGSVMMSVAFVVLGLAGHHGNHGVGLLHRGLGNYLIASLMLLCGGAFLSIWEQQELSNGVQSARWTDAELSFVREIFGGWVNNIALFILMGMGMMALLMDRSHQHRNVSMVFWVCFVLGNGLMSLKRALVAPPPSQPQTWLQPSAPIHSEHWGESSQGV